MIRLEKLLKKGGMSNGDTALKSKNLIHRLKKTIENAAKPYFGGVHLDDLAFSFPLAFIYIVIFISVFFYLLVNNLNSTVGKRYLSLEWDPKHCTKLATPLAGQWGADLDGNWDTSNEFHEKSSIFVLEANGADINDQMFKTAMRYFQDEMNKYSQYAANRTMAWNLLILSSLTFKHKDTGLGLCLSVDASFIFDDMIKVATLSNRNGICLGYNASSSKGGRPRYLSGLFKTENAALVLEMPFRINPSSVEGSTAPNFRVTFTPSVEEPCPQHGQWFKNVFFGAESQYRDSYADIGFDVRSTFLAIAINLGRVGTESLVRKDTEITRAFGMVGLVDPYYTFPHMARVYCLNKSSSNWADYGFSQEEISEQVSYFNWDWRKKAHEYTPLKFPNICFVVSVAKGNSINFFYPMVSMLKRQREEKCVGSCYSGCTCPQDRLHVDCNRQSLYASYFYDSNFPLALPNRFSNVSWVPSPQRTKNDDAIKLGIAIQKEMMKWKKKEYYEKKNIDSSNDYDVKAMQLFDNVVSATLGVYSNPAKARANINSPAGPLKTLAKSWDILLGKVKEHLPSNAQLKSGRLPSVSAIVFRSYGSFGYG